MRSSLPTKLVWSSPEYELTAEAKLVPVSPEYELTAVAKLVPVSPEYELTAVAKLVPVSPEYELTAEAKVAPDLSDLRSKMLQISTKTLAQCAIHRHEEDGWSMVMEWNEIQWTAKMWWHRNIAYI